MATLLGDGITVDELAHHFGTIGYEVLTSLGRRYARVYKRGNADMPVQQPVAAPVAAAPPIPPAAPVSATPPTPSSAEPSSPPPLPG
jgi:alanine racemase